MEQHEIDALKAELMAEGFDANIAEALAENEVTVDAANAMSPEAALDLFLTYNGIIGYTRTILSALECLEYHCHG